MSSSRSLLSLGLQKEVLTALTRNGYENLRDLISTTAEGLAKDINIPIADAQALTDRCQASQTSALTHTMTQSAAVMVQRSHKTSTKCASLDKALEGGISRGHVLEISGPPGSAKEQLLMNIVAAFVEVNEEVIFIDCQNMTSPASLIKFLQRSINLPPNFKQRLHYTKIHTLPELMLFLHQLPALLISHPKTSLVVFNSFYFPFQNTKLAIPKMKPLYDKIKETFSQVCASGQLTIVTTSQLSIKMINADGSSGSYDSGAHGILSPYLGDSYLPHAKAHRVMLCPDGPDTGFVASNYRSRMRMILTEKKVYKGVIVPEASPRTVSLKFGALFYREWTRSLMVHLGHNQELTIILPILKYSTLTVGSDWSPRKDKRSSVYHRALVGISKPVPGPKAEHGESGVTICFST